MTPHDRIILYIELPIMLCSFAGMIFLDTRVHEYMNIKPAVSIFLLFGPYILVPPIYLGASVMVAWVLKSVLYCGLILIILGETRDEYPFDLNLPTCAAIMAASVFLYEPIVYAMRVEKKIDLHPFKL